MSDPQKEYICIRCGFEINDSQRNWGNQTQCLVCEEIEYLLNLAVQDKSKLEYVCNKLWHKYKLSYEKACAMFYVTSISDFLDSTLLEKKKDG